MIRILDSRIYEDGKNYVEYAGLSTDTKPTANIITGSSFVEVDTGDAYLFDEVGEDWYKIGGGE